MTKGRLDVLTAVCTVCLILAGTAVGAAPPDRSDQEWTAWEAYRREWTDLTRTEAFSPGPFVPGRIRPLVRSVAPAVRTTVFGYYAAEGVDGIDFSLLSHLGLAFVQAEAGGTIVKLPLTTFPGWYEAVNAAHAEGVKVVLVVANVDKDRFRPDVAAAILSSKANRDRLIANLVGEVKLNELDGVSVDFEEVGGAYRDEFTSFVADLAGALRRENPEYHVSVATPTYDWAGFFDYPVLANVADALLMMQYAYHFLGSGVAGPQAPLERDGEKSVLDSIRSRYLAAGVPADKLVLLMPYYGYLWHVRADADPRVAGAAVTGVKRRVRIDETGLPNLTYDETIDLRGQSFHYQTSGGWLQGWVDDAASIGKKCDLARELGLQGVGIWRLEYGKDYPELWDEIERRFATSCPTGALPIPNDRWRLEAWNNRTLSGPRAEVRYDAPGSNGFEFDWGSDPPSDCLGQENFSVRFSRLAYFPASTTYAFSTVADDGVRLGVDSAVVIERWEAGEGPKSAAATTFVTRGWHNLRLDYYQARGDAMVRLTWRPDSPCNDDVPAGSWRGLYFANPTLSGSPTMVRDDGAGFLSLDWGAGSPGPSCGLPADGFSAQWTRTVPFEKGTYRFTASGEGGLRLLVDGTARLDAWASRVATRRTVDIALEQGTHAIAFEYRDDDGDAAAGLAWERAGAPATALLAPVAAGQTLTVVHGYNDPLPGEVCVIGRGPDHCGNQRYGLDLTTDRPGDTRILAPLPGTVDWVSGDCLGLRTADDLNLNVCHFGRFDVRKGDSVARGTVLGARSTSWIHLSLDDRYHNPVRPFPPVLFNGAHTIEGVAFDPLADDRRNQHHGRAFVSTNLAPDGDGAVDCSRFVADITYEDGTPVDPEETINKGWRLHNCGTTTWGYGTLAVRVDGSFGPATFGVPEVSPGASGALWAGITVPTTAATHRATYQLASPRGNFGDRFWVEVVVRGPGPTPRPSPTPPPYPTPGTDCAAFVRDVNWPDGSIVAPGATITKRWGLRNCGGTVWDLSDGYKAVRIGGSYGPAEFRVPAASPGQVVEVAADIVVPTSAGRHRATYRLAGPAGNFGDPFWVEVVVSDLTPTPAPTPTRTPSPTATHTPAPTPQPTTSPIPTPSPTRTATPPPQATATPSPTSTPTPGTDCAAFVRDVNWPDGSVVAPGATITKRWELRNCGGTVWDLSDGYKAVRIGGGYGPGEFRVPAASPGQVVEVAADIVVPTSAGRHRATYRLTGPAGNFGDPFWVEVVVSGTTPTPPPTPTRTPTPAPTNDCAAFVRDVNYPDGTMVVAGTTITKRWELRNCGNTTWSAGGYKAVRIGGSYGPSEFSAPTAGPGMVVELSTRLQVPTTSGTHRATYRLRGPRGYFGDQFWIEVLVVPGPVSVGEAGGG